VAGQRVFQIPTQLALVSQPELLWAIADCGSATELTPESCGVALIVNSKAPQ